MNSPHSTNWLQTAAAATPDEPALVLDDGVVSFGELDDVARRAASGLHSRFEVGPGSVLGVGFGPPRLDKIGAMWGAWSLGAAVLPLDLGRRDADSVARSAGAAALLSGLDIGWPRSDAAVGRDSGSPHTLIRTSGTSGEPRLVVLTHGNVAAAVAASQQRIGNEPGDRWLLVLPLFHVGGMSVLWRSAAARAAVVIHERFEARRVATALRSGEATFVSLVPTMLRRVLETGGGPYPGQPTVLLGGASAPPALVERGLDAGLRLLTTYGLTEACSQVATVVPGHERESLGTVGPPLGSVRVSLLDESGDEVPAGRVGRIAVEGPTVSPGYIGETEKNLSVVTGDIGRFDDGGRLVVLGRADDVIVTGGENVHPAEVEAVLLAHPAVSDAAVFGIPDEEWGEAVVAVMVLWEGTAIDVADHARAYLPAYAVPRHWRLRSSIPRTSMGKVDREEIRSGLG